MSFFNAHVPSRGSFFQMDTKGYPIHGQDSLFRLATFGEASQQHDTEFSLLFPRNDFQELSLTVREMLNLSDDLLFEEQDDDPLMTAPILETQLIPTATSSTTRVESPVTAPELSLALHTISPLPREESEDEEKSPKKRPRSTTSSCVDSNETKRFRQYQTGQWEDRFQELCLFRDQHGHCLVPHSFEDSVLARWVKRQRYQYKLMMDGMSSTMTLERVQTLEGVGFCWDSQSAAWGERLQELKLFKQQHGHTNVPSKSPEHVQLSTWIKCQRRQYKLKNEGQPCNITEQRIEELDKLGFKWQLRRLKTKAV